MNMDKRLFLLAGISVLATVILFSGSPIKQDSHYHNFADTRVVANIPNFFNTISNVPFLIVGILGIRLVLSTELKPVYANYGKFYLVFFIGVFLIGIGSGYYHWHPDNSSLVWDRLTMTVSFMSFFCLVIAECISVQLAKYLLLPLLTLGFTSVVYWYVSELRGFGDIRAYLLIQFLPAGLLPLILWLYKSNCKNCSYLWGVLGAYFLAKLAESFDAQLYNALIYISGHTIKHLLAGMGTLIVYLKLKDYQDLPLIN